MSYYNTPWCYLWCLTIHPIGPKAMFHRKRRREREKIILCFLHPSFTHQNKIPFAKAYNMTFPFLSLSLSFFILSFLYYSNHSPQAFPFFTPDTQPLRPFSDFYLAVETLRRSVLLLPSFSFLPIPCHRLFLTLYALLLLQLLWTFTSYAFWSSASFICLYRGKK